MSGLKREACLIDGRWRSGDRWLAVENPATGQVIGRVPDFGALETAEAIEAAQSAMPAWRGLTAGARGTVLRRFFEAIMDHRDDLASLLTLEQGKPLAEAAAEITYAASFIDWFAEEGRRIYGEVIPSHAVDRRIIVIKQPVGVVAAITPWNFPAAMITRKIGPALAAACAVVVKPSELTPFTALALGVLAQEAGLPNGLLNIVTGDAREIGAALTASPEVRKISFTGSTAVGASLYAASGPTVKKLSLELGGNAPFIVFDDADVDAAVAGAIASKFRNAGQTCVCANRFYVQSGVYDAFLEAFVQAVRKLQVGSGDDPGVDVGPLIDNRAIAKVRAHIADALDKGAQLVTGGDLDPRGGRFFSPTVLGGVTAEMRIAQEETFGPVAAILRFEDEDDVVAQANATESGLAAYFYARDVGRVWRVAEAIATGIVGVNTGLISTAAAPFGGVKTSGLGREGSRHGIEDYLEIKYICLGL